MADKTIGIIAGTSQFPLLFAKAAKKRGLRVVAVAHKGETFPELEAEVDEITWIQLGQVGKLLKAFRKAGVNQAVMCGGVTKTRMFKDVRPDMKALALINRIRHMADDGILRTLADYLSDEGVKVIASHDMVPELLAQEGVYTRRKPDSDEQQSAEVGWQVCAQMGCLDIGQCVVVRDRAVVAVEAIEGTDACIARGGELARGKAVVVKRCKPIQDMRFDLPSVGLRTIEVMKQSGCSCLLIEAEKTLIFDKDLMIDLADKSGICVMAWATGDENNG